MSHEHKNFKIFKSSAGSGKTFTLVKEYLTIVLGEPAFYRNVLAITFTNKAAGEMKERIINELKALSAGEDSPMLQLVQEATGLPHTTLAENAREVLAAILHDYGNFAVSTIDSFTYRLIRNFARDLDLPSKFDVETDTQALLERMVDQLMDTIGRDPYITQILVHFAEEKLREESGWHIDRDIGDVARELFKEGSKAPIDTLHSMEPEEFMDFIGYIREEKEDYPIQMAALGKKAADMITKASLSPGDFLGGSRGSCVNVLWKVQKKVSPGDYQKLIETGRFAAAVADDKWHTRKARAAEIDVVLDQGLRAAAQALSDYHHEHYDRFLTAHHAYQNIHSLAVLRQIEELMDVYKEQQNLVHISDFQEKIADFIQSEAPDYIYWRLGERFRHYLLDEFQDTSILQWLNLVPLFDYIRTDADRDGSLLLVGDSKQAIYRWRGGETELLENIAPGALEVEPEILGRNFRSMEFVVDFNNRFFAKVRDILHANDQVRSIYTDFEQAIRPGNENKGLVQMALLEGKKNEEFKENALARLVEQVREMQVQGFSLSDMAVLVRTGKDGSEIARHLNEHGIRVISSDSILLSRAPIIGFLIALLKFLIDARDKIAQAEVLNYYFTYLGVQEQDLFSEVHNPQAKIRELLQAETAIKEIFNELPPQFQSLSYQLDRLPLYELVERIIQIFKLQSISPAYLQHFLDVVQLYGERKKPDLAGFLEHWEQHKDKFSVIVPEGENAVEIITIHKSKGLEFPVVFIPFANWEIQPRHTHAFWAKSSEGFGDYPDTYLVQPKKELAESSFKEDYEAELNKTLLDNINLLYVAFTRPRERLYVYAPVWNRRSTDPPTIRDIRTTGHLINLIMEEDDFKGLDDELYETGFPLPPQAHAEASASFEAREFLSLEWRDRIRIDRRYRKYWEGGNEQEKSGFSDGTLMAEALRRMSESEELPLLLNDLQEEGLIDEQRRWALEEKLEKVLVRPPLKAWFSDPRRVRRATEILTPGGETFGPDRLMMQDGEATVVQFLDRGREKPPTKQLKAYAKALKEMGHASIRTFACYLPDGKVETVKVK